MMDNKQLNVFIYYSYIYKIGGIETWIYNMCQNLYKYYNITVLFDDANIEQLKRYNEYVKIQKRDISKNYKCDVLIYASHLNKYPNNIQADKSISVVHSDYEYYKDLIDSFIIGEHSDTIVSVSDKSAESLKKICNKDSIVIPNILGKEKETHKILHLVSFTRLTKEKGYERMCKLIRMFKDNKIKFDWKIFSDIDDLDVKKIMCEEVIFMKPTLDTFDYIKDADYLVQLSDTEAFCYSVHEALQCGTPVIVTDIDVFRDIVINGENGYKLDMNLSKVDVMSIYNHIPNKFEYDAKFNDISNAWIDVIGTPVEKCNNNNIEEKTLEVIEGFYDLKQNKLLNVGDIFTTNYLRAYELCSHNNNSGKILCKVLVNK